MSETLERDQERSKQGRSWWKVLLIGLALYVAGRAGSCERDRALYPVAALGRSEASSYRRCRRERASRDN
jgi:hypothetical protein